MPIEFFCILLFVPMANMKFVFGLVLFGLCALALTSPVTQENKSKVADKEFLERQIEILKLFKHVNQESHDKRHIEIARSYSIEKNVGGYTKPEVVEQFLRHYKYGMLPRREIFSVFHEKHMKQAKVLFELFFHAKDYETFYKTAVWARNHINEGMFLYAVSVAIVHRPDTHGIILPPIYEICPHYFFNSEVIHKAQYYKQIHQEHEQSNVVDSHEGHLIIANYSGHYLNLHPDQSLSYYLEDVGLNAMYYYYHIHYPYWLEVKNDNRGEIFYYVHQQMLARYYSERLSWYWGEIENFDWDQPFKTGYYPSLRYPNGLEFPTRPNHANLYEYFYTYGQKYSFKSKYGYSHTFVKDYERRIRDVVDHGFVFTHDGQKVDLNTKEGFNVLGNIIESNPDSPDSKYFGAIQVYARHLLGYAFQPLDDYKLIPSALEHYETSMRDPAFYQLYKKIVLYFQRYLSHLSPYTEKELHFPGVKVDKVEVDPLVTYFDHFDSDITNAVFATPEETEQFSFKVQARQHRLNHKPFTYKVHVKSDKDTKAVVKVFLGPKHDEYGRYINITENRINFYQLDHLTYDLKTGDNVISRNSYEFYHYGPDRTTYRELYNQVTGAHKDKGEFHLDGKQSSFYFPQRYMLPKGRHTGQEFQFYVIVAPYVPFHNKPEHVKHEDYAMVGTGEIRVDGYPLGYPFDRFIEFGELFYNVPNAHFHDVKIFHKEITDINASHSEH